jgi:hypothetical protein
VINAAPLCVNVSADFYRYFDATPQAEFLYVCVKETALEDLPMETDYLRGGRAFRQSPRRVP